MLISGMLLVGCMLNEENDVQNRLENTLSDIQLSSKEMEEYVLSRLRSATPESLQHATLTFARLHLYPHDSAGEEPPIENAAELLIVFDWMQAEPNVRGICIFSPASGLEAKLLMSSEQLEYVKKTAERYVSYMNGCRAEADSENGQKILKMVRNGEASVVLIDHDGDRVGEAVPLSRRGEPFGTLATE